MTQLFRYCQKTISIVDQAFPALTSIVLKCSAVQDSLGSSLRYPNRCQDLELLAPEALDAPSPVAVQWRKHRELII